MTKSELLQKINEWAQYAFKNHGNDAKLYNGLKDLYYDVEVRCWIEPVRQPLKDVGRGDP